METIARTATKLALRNSPAQNVSSALWGLKNSGQAINGLTGKTGADIQATKAWKLERGNKGVIVAVVDTGFNFNHPALQPNIHLGDRAEWQFGESQQHDFDPYHGTHVAAIAVGAEVGNGFVGVAPNCSLLPVTVRLTDAHINDRVTAIEWLAELALTAPNYRYVINLSWEMLEPNDKLHTAIKNAVNNGALVVAATSNIAIDTATWPRYPAGYDEVIGVAATDHCDRKVEFSAFGPDIDVCAPGASIYSAWGDEYQLRDGSSQACPYVAGVAALVWSRNQLLDNHAVRDIVQSSCDSIDELNPEYRGKLGAGRVNAYKAVRATPPATQIDISRKPHA